MQPGSLALGSACKKSAIVEEAPPLCPQEDWSDPERPEMPSWTSRDSGSGLKGRPLGSISSRSQLRGASGQWGSDTDAAHCVHEEAEKCFRDCRSEEIARSFVDGLSCCLVEHCRWQMWG